MTALQQIVKEAKRMRKLHPNKYAKWTDYVKAASKAIKKRVKKVSGPKAKAKPKTKAKPKPATHTDKGSHNVKIKVVSGLSKSSQFHINMVSQLLKQIEKYQMVVNDVKEQLKTPFGKANKLYLLNKQKEAKKNIVLLKKSLSIHKQSIK